MTTQPNPNNSSQIDLDAMLYVLEDAALDRESFELRLADDPEIAEAVANAVFLLESLRSVPVKEAIHSKPYPSSLPNDLISEPRSRSSYFVSLATVCACIATVLIAWNAMTSPLNDKQSLDEIALAWTAIQTIMSEQTESFTDAALSIEEEEADTGEWGTPAWLIVATAVHDSNSGDTGIQ